MSKIYQSIIYLKKRDFNIKIKS